MTTQDGAGTAATATAGNSTLYSRSNRYQNNMPGNRRRQPSRLTALAAALVLMCKINATDEHLVNM